MAKSFRNLFSLSADETIASSYLRDYFGKKFEIFIPLNSQLKGIDLAAINLENKKSATIQIKGSKGYEPQASEVDKYGDGCSGWFFIDQSKIDNALADYFVFVLYTLGKTKDKIKTEITHNFVTIETNELKNLCKEKKIPHGNQKNPLKKPKYCFYIWVNPEKKEAFDFRDTKSHGKIIFTKYLNTKGFQQIKKSLS